MEVLRLDSQRIYDMYLASRQTALLTVAVRLGVFQLLDATPMSADQLRAQLQISERGADALIVGLQALQLIEQTPLGYRATEEASRFLVPGRTGYLGALIDLEMNQFLTPERLYESMISGKPGVYDTSSGDDAWDKHQQDPEKARAFTLGMHSISEVPAGALAAVFDASSHHRVLDIGGGSGVFVIALLERWAHLNGTVVDLGPVCQVAQDLFAQAGLSDRAGVAHVDMFREEFPSGYDIVLFSQIIHDWDVESNRSLLAKAWRALPSGGQVVIHEKLLNEQRTGPVANALVSLDMLYWTEGKQYTSTEIHTLLIESGFIKPNTRATTGYWSVVTAVKP